MKRLKRHDCENKIEKVKKQIVELGVAIPGTLRTTYMKCGKENCPCYKDKSARHGPYYFWDRKVSAKLTSKSIPKSQLPLLKKGINNRRVLERLVGELLALNQAMITDIIDSESQSSKK